MTATAQRLWLIRLGRDGEHEPEALDRNLLNIGFSMVRDLSGAGTRDQVLDMVRQTFPEAIRADLPLRPIWTLVAEGEPGG